MTPPPKHEKVEKDGYVLTFYPGFLSKASVLVDGKDDVLYRQEKPHKVKDKPDEPLKRFELRLRGGPNDRNITLHVDDPQHAIAEITIRMYPKGYKPEAGEDPPPDEVFTAANDAILCPPMC